MPTVLGNNTLWMPFNGSARAWSTGRERHVDNVGAAIAEARKAEEATYAAYGKLGPVRAIRISVARKTNSKTRCCTLYTGFECLIYDGAPLRE